MSARGHCGAYGWEYYHQQPTTVRRAARRHRYPPPQPASIGPLGAAIIPDGAATHSTLP